MAAEIVPPSLAEAPMQSADAVDPHGYLQPAMRVVGAHGKALGKVASLEREAGSGCLSTLTVRHGLFRPALTAVPARQVKWVNRDSVVLELSPADFRRLPRVGAGTSA